MSDITHLPTRAEFIRDRLAEHLDGLGYFGLSAEPETFDQSPTLYFEWATGDRCVFVDDMGAIRDMDEPERADGRTLTMRGFEWWPEPTDTGVMHDLPRPHQFVLPAAYRRWVAQRPGTPIGVGHRVPGTTRTV